MQANEAERRIIAPGLCIGVMHGDPDVFRQHRAELGEHAPRVAHRASAVAAGLRNSSRVNTHDEAIFTGH